MTYHPPSGAFSDEITVVCPPFFGECQRTQLSLRELAISLAAAGQHVVRFDYRGTGDSFGDAPSLDAWSEDLERVIAEARDLSGCTRVNVAAVRAATLLLPIWMSGAQSMGRVAVWDPVWHGRRYLEEYFAYRASSNFRNRWLSAADRKATGGELLGFPFPESLAESIEASDYRDWTPPVDIAAIYTEQPPADAPAINAKQIRFKCRWGTFSDDILMPGPVLEELRECLIKH
ncbi:MAG: hypothetical protein AAGL69_03760 [Pseudomonadota bacterium]